MSNTDERLSDLLAERARQGSGVHPTREGVSVAVTRRAARRRRRRTVVTGFAGLCLVTGVVGGLALAGDDDSQDGFTDPTGPLPEVPLVGMNINDFELTSAAITPVEDSGEPPLTHVIFRSPGALASPLMTVVVRPGFGDELLGLGGTPVDLDGDGQSNGPRDGFLTSATTGGTSVEWFLADGRIAGVGGYGLAQEAVVDYASDLATGSLDLAEPPAPDGLTDRSTAIIPSGLPVEEATATYANGDGEIRVTVRNEPGWFDYLQLYSTSTYGGFTEATVGDSFLGPSRAIVTEPALGHPYALILTDSGLTIEVSTDSSDTPAALDVHELQDLLAAGAFVEVEPTDGPPTTTALAPATTAPPVTSRSTTSVPSSQGLPSVTRTVDDQGEHLTIEFDGVPPALGTTTMLENLTGDCARFEADFERIFQENGEEPYWQGWLTVELQTSLVGIAGPVFGGPALGSAEDPGYILCQDGADPATIAIPIANLGEPIVTPLSGRPAVLIDIPRT